MLNLKPISGFASFNRPVAAWSRIARQYGIEGENGLAGLLALILLPAGLAASLAFSLPLALPLALTTINLSFRRQSRGTAVFAGIGELALAALLLVMAMVFVALAFYGVAPGAAVAGAVLSVSLAFLPAILCAVVTSDPDNATGLSRDVAGLDRLAPDERLVIVDRTGRVFAASMAAMRQFAESGIRPGTDLLQLIDSRDRPIFLNALDKATAHERNISLRLDGDQWPHRPGAALISFSLQAIDSRMIILRPQESSPVALQDRKYPDFSAGCRNMQTGGVADRTVCDLVDAVRFATRILAGEAETRGVQVAITELPGADKKPARLIDCPARAARQIAINLIGNAIKFSHAGAQVEIAIDGDDKTCRLKVRDCGIGIAEPELKALFRPHKHSGNGDRPGCGLGLAIVSDLVAGCDGRIFFQSAPGVGTTVTVQFPSVDVDHRASRNDLQSPRTQTRQIARAA